MSYKKNKTKICVRDVVEITTVWSCVRLLTWLQRVCRRARHVPTRLIPPSRSQLVAPVSANMHSPLPTSAAVRIHQSCSQAESVCDYMMTGCSQSCQVTAKLYRLHEMAQVVSFVWVLRCIKGVRSFGWQDVWATDVWARNFCPNIHLGDTKLDVWATRTRRLGDKSKSLNLGQSHRPGSCMRSLAVIICFSTNFSKVHRRFNNTDRQRLKRLWRRLHAAQKQRKSRTKWGSAVPWILALC